MKDDDREERVTRFGTALARFVHELLIAADAPIIVGMSGPQGGGKSTLAEALVTSISASHDVNAVAVSIDDFYLTNREQRALAKDHPRNRYLEHRGYPGTHDVALGEEVLHELSRTNPGTVAIPSYDKSLENGRGDRAPRSTWRTVTRPVDLIVLEGWMLGFQRQDDVEDLDLRVANDALTAYGAWHRHLHAFIHLIARSPDDIVRFRIDAESERRARGQSALSDEEARDYIERFLPAYALYVEPLRRAPPVLPAFQVELDADRSPLSFSVKRA